MGESFYEQIGKIYPEIPKEHRKTKSGASGYSDGVRFARLAGASIAMAADARIAELEAALRAVIGHGFAENSSPLATQDYVSKRAIALVRAALKDITGE